MLKTLGVDPGAKGGLAMSGKAVVMPESLSALADLIREWAPDRAIIEAVHAFPGQGVVSCFTFGQAFGGVLGVLSALSVPHRLVEPKAWHASILGQPEWPASLSRAERRAAWKQLAIDHCKRVWPDLDLKASKRCRVDHDGMADALCISTYDYEQAKSL